MWEWSENKLIYDEDVLWYLNNHEKVRNTLPKIIANIFDKLGDVKLKAEKPAFS